nr:PREDICTED: hormone-sensitive lipase [Anolis carolinensis]|eukprot:XP_016854866.1 PREDICTED: hormone-sensitive lipase [Anolis carolinensis]
MRLISHELREGQDSEELLQLLLPEGTLALELRWKARPAPPSPFLVVHFHGGGFVAQTSKSHEPYLKAWAQELGAPVLSIDYSLAPEAPFPRALEEFTLCQNILLTDFSSDLFSSMISAGISSHSFPLYAFNLFTSRLHTEL